MGEEPASNSGNDPDTARRIAQERRIAKEGRQAEREKRAGWIAAEDVLEGADNPDALMKALISGAVDCLFVHPTRWWLAPSTVPEEIWEGARFKNGQLWRNGICLEGPHQQLVVNEQQWREYLTSARPAARSPEEPSAAPESAATPAMSLAPGPQAEQPSPPPKARTTKRTTIEEYTAFQNDYLKKYRVYASRKAERDWAKAKGCSAQHVRDELRPQYRDGLQPAERTKFQSHSKKAQPPDDGR